MRETSFPAAVWRRLEVGLWVALPALASLAALVLEPKWRLFYVAAAFVAIPIALVVRDARLWLFLAGVLSAFNFTKVVAGDPTSARHAALAVGAIDIPILVMLAICFVRVTSERVEVLQHARIVRIVLLFGLAFVGWSALGAAGAPLPDVTLTQALVYVRLFLALGVVAACARDAARVRWALLGLFLALFAQCAIAGAQYVAGSSFGLYEHFEEDTATASLTRSGGTLNPTVLSEYIGVVAPLALAAAFTARRRAGAAALFAVFGAAGTASVLTLSRGGLLNIGITTCLVLAVTAPSPAVSRSRKLAVGVGILALVAVLTVCFSTSLMARIAALALEVEGEDARGAQFQQALTMIAANPLRGVGLGNYLEVMGQYGPTLPYPVHNKFLLVTAETGIPGGLLYAVPWGYALSVLARRAIDGAGAPERIFHAGFAASIFGTLLNMNTDVYGTGGAPELALFLVVGLGLASGGWQPDPRWPALQGRGGP